MIPVSPTRKQAQSGEGTCQKPSGQSAFGLCWSPLYSAASAPLRPRGQAAGGEAGRGTDQGALGLGQKQVQRKASLAAGRGLVTWRATDRIRPAPPPVLSVPSPPWRGTPHPQEPQTQSAETAAGTVVSAPRPAPARGLRWVRARPLALSPSAG